VLRGAKLFTLLPQRFLDLVDAPAVFFKSLILLADPARFELTTSAFGGQCYIRSTLQR
jgi:hypothetical protein